MHGAAADMLALLQKEPTQASTPEPATSLSCLGRRLTKQQICDLDLAALQSLWEVSAVCTVTSCRGPSCGHSKH